MKVRELIEKLQDQNPDQQMVVSMDGLARYFVNQVEVDQATPDGWGADLCSANPSNPEAVEVVFVTAKAIQ